MSFCEAHFCGPIPQNVREILISKDHSVIRISFDHRYGMFCSEFSVQVRGNPQQVSWPYPHHILGKQGNIRQSESPRLEGVALLGAARPSLLAVDHPRGAVRLPCQYKPFSDVRISEASLFERSPSLTSLTSRRLVQDPIEHAPPQGRLRSSSGAGLLGFWDVPDARTRSANEGRHLGLPRELSRILPIFSPRITGRGLCR